jgi:chlorite dismutase
VAEPIPVCFVGGDQGAWRVEKVAAVRGESLPSVARIDALALRTPPPGAAWVLRGVTGHQRYVNAREGAELRAVQAGLGRPEATRAALIPIRKSEAWWDLAQDERRAIFEERSAHIAASMRYLPAIARRLYQSRELGEPFDFLTWFEFAPEHAGAFEELVAMLRATEEWKWVVREVDIRLAR